MKSFKLTAVFILIFLTVLSSLSFGQKLDQAKLNALAKKYGVQSFDLLHEFLSIPNDAHFPDHIQKNMQWVEAAFQKRNFEISVLPTGGPPLLLAERRVDDNSKTVLIYLQIDGQPVDPRLWYQESPYKPVLKEKQGTEWREISWQKLKGEINPDWRVFARSASDAKGPVVAFLTALDAFDGEALMQVYNIKVIMDFEEEQGSPHLPPAVEQHKAKLAADMLIIFDGPRHLTNRPTLTFGARGIATITLIVFGPRVPQHSGHYGNFVPNPAIRLAQLLGSMEDDVGRVVIPGFYDGIELDEKTRAILARVPDDETDIKRKLGIATTDQVASTYQESLQYPSLNIRGMASGWIGDKVRTIIPGTATAEIDVRLVPETKAERLIDLIKKHVRSRGYYLIGNREPTEEERMQHGKIVSFVSNISYGAFQTPFDSEVGIWLNKAMVRAFGQEPVRHRTSGGSIPISPFVVTLGVPAVTVPIVNRDNNQHSPNENLRIGNYIEGVKTFLAILTEPFEI